MLECRRLRSTISVGFLPEFVSDSLFLYEKGVLRDVPWQYRLALYTSTNAKPHRNIYSFTILIS